MNSNLFEKLKKISLSPILPDHDDFFSLAEKTVDLLECENPLWRPVGKNGKSGGLVDFSQKVFSDVPVIIVPDLHARCYFLFDVLKFVPSNLFDTDGLSVFEAVSLGKAKLVCVGDFLHSELRGRERWLRAWGEFQNEIYDGSAMSEEMAEGFSLLQMVMEIKNAFPENVHLLKGNHENIYNKRGGGDFPFGKFAYEGEMVKNFVHEYYGDDILMIVSAFEKALPLMIAFKNCVISHAEPKIPFSRKQVIDGMGDDTVVAGLTWTENNNAVEGSVAGVLASVLPDNYNKAYYFAGHRPVKGRYKLRQKSVFVQLHNPEAENIALVPVAEKFNPDKHIVSVI